MTADPADHNRRELDAEGIPDLADPINQDEGMIPPRDHPQAVDEPATTAVGQRLGDSLTDRMLREEPDFGQRGSSALDAVEALDETGSDGGIGGRLVDAGSADVEGLDDEKEVTASLVGDAGSEGALSAEEAAMHITESP